MSALNRVLLIEDNPGDARLVSEYLLERYGNDCALREASTLADGLAALETRTYDVVLLDLGLPDSTGLATYFAVNALVPGTPVVILTGDDDEGAALEALHAGADDYLAKQDADSAALSRAMRHAVQRRRLSMRLRDSEARYRAMVETAEEGILQTDPAGVISVSNARAAQLLHPMRAGPSAQQALVGQSLQDFVEPADLPALQPLLSLEEGRRVSRELRLQRDDGRPGWVLAAAGRMADSPGRPGGVVLMLTDITDRRLAEDELLALQQELEARVKERTASLQALNEDLEAFSVTVAHDLRTPLNGILGFAALMRADAQHGLPGPQAHRLQIIEQSARSMDELIGCLLQLARLGRQAMVVQPLDLSAIAQAGASELSRAAPQRVVHWRIEPGLAADGDATLVAVMLNNLLNNAWKYSAQALPATIEVGRVASATTNPATYFVRDNGIGFDMAGADEMFMPFHRLPSARGFAGSGIGLATVRRVVERHGGRVWAESQPGAGACFYFTLAAPPAGDV